MCRAGARGVAIAALVGIACVLAAPVVAQDDVPPQDDDLLRRINEELDNRATAEGELDDILGRTSRAEQEQPNLILRGIFALCVVLALILLAYAAVRRWGQKMPLVAGGQYGQVLGRLYLDRGAALHFVRVRDRVLIVGVATGSVSLVAEVPASEFGASPAFEGGGEPEAFNADSFLAQLHAHSAELVRPGEVIDSTEEDEIAALRGDIQRLQRYLREESRGQED